MRVIHGNSSPETEPVCAVWRKEAMWVRALRACDPPWHYPKGGNRAPTMLEILGFTSRLSSIRIFAKHIKPCARAIIARYSLGNSMQNP